MLDRTAGKLVGLLLLPAAALLISLPDASRAGDEPRQYLVEYQAYNTALEAQDREAAVTHARAAWLGAEKALGIHRTTGVLAYNYGRLIVFDDPVYARKVLRRAHALHEAGIVELPGPELRLFWRYAEFAASEDPAGEADELREALRAVDDDGDGDPALATMWFELALRDYAGHRLRKTIESAARAETQLLKVPPDESNRLAQAILIGGIARLALTEDNAHPALAAREQFRRARLLFPPQKDLETFDPLLAHVVAWNEAARTLLALMRCGRPYASCTRDTEDAPALPPLFSYQNELSCEEIVWIEKQTPRFPSFPSRRYGAVLVGYRLGDDLRIHDARILAQVPRDWYGDDVLETMSGWRAKEMPAGDPACYQNLTAIVRVADDTPKGASGGT